MANDVVADDGWFDPKDESVGPLAKRLKEIAKRKGFAPDFIWQGRPLRDVLKEYTPPKNGFFTDRWLERSGESLPFTYTLYEPTRSGFGVEIAPNGKKKFLLQTKFPGASSQARRKLGFYPAMGLKAAREKAAEQLALVKAGRDPADEARKGVEAAAEERRAEALKNKETFASTAEAYIDSRINRRKAVDAQEIRRMLISAWGPRPIHSIQPSDVIELFTRLVRHAAYDGKNAWLHASGIFKWAMFKNLIAVSPLARVDKKQLFPKGTIKTRERYLNAEELQAFWAGTERLGPTYRELFRLLLLTGARLSEVARARWVELDPALRKALRDATQAKTPVNWSAIPDEIKTLTIPRERYKSDHEFVIQLSHDALAIIEQLWRDRSGEFLFSSTAALSTAKARLDAYMLEHLRQLAAERGEDPAKVELPRWKTHDLRRTVRTNLSKLKVPKVPHEVRELVLGHSLKGLDKTYDQHDFAVEIREALTAWAARLQTIVTPPPSPAPTTADNVVNLPRQRKRA